MQSETFSGYWGSSKRFFLIAKAKIAVIFFTGAQKVFACMKGRSNISPLKSIEFLL